MSVLIIAFPPDLGTTTFSAENRSTAADPGVALIGTIAFSLNQIYPTTVTSGIFLKEKDKFPYNGVSSASTFTTPISMLE